MANVNLNSLKESIFQAANQKRNIDSGGDVDDENIKKTQSTIDSLKKRMQVGIDAKKMSKNDFNKKYGSLSKEERKQMGLNYVDNPSEIDFHSDVKDNDNYSESIINNQINKQVGSLEKFKKEYDISTQGAKKASDSMREYLSKKDLLSKNKQAFMSKYKVDPEEATKPVDFEKEYRKGILESAQKTINEGKGIPIPGEAESSDAFRSQVEKDDTKSRATCISGVCSLASDQGIDFSKLQKKGLAMKDAKGRYIPIQNKAFKENIADTGYEEVPYEQRQPGDFIQYDDKNNTPEHMELILNPTSSGNKTFNNYGLYNYGKDYATPQRKLQKDASGKIIEVAPDKGADNFRDARIFRPKKETYEQAYLRKNPEYANIKSSISSPEYSEYSKSKQNLTNIDRSALGSDAGVMDEILSGYSDKYKSDKEGLKKSVSTKIKNPKLVNRAIDMLYEGSSDIAKKD